MADLVLPAFEMDCRDWIVLSPADAGLPEEVAGSPLLAVLSTVVIEDDVREATGALTIGLMDPTDDLLGMETREVAPGAPVHELLDDESAPETRRYLMPSPNGQPLALLAEFAVPADQAHELDRRVDRLMHSFKWQAD